MTTSELIARLERKLASAQRIPAHRREAEYADTIEETCHAMLADLMAGRPLVSDDHAAPATSKLGSLSVVSIGCSFVAARDQA